MSTPLLSVVVTVGRGTSAINPVLHSLQVQDFDAWQAVILAHGAPNATQQALAQLAAADPRFCILDEPSANPAQALNRALQHVAAPRVLFWQGPHALGAMTLSAFADAVQRDPGTDVHCLGWRYAGIDAQLGPVQRLGFGPKPFAALAGQFPFPMQAALFRTDILRDLGGFDPALTISSGWDIAQRLARIGGRFRGIPGPVVQVSQPGSSEPNALHALLEEGLTIIRRGHGPDPRLDGRAQLAAMPAGDASAAELAWAATVAGRAAVAGQSSERLLPDTIHVPVLPDPARLARAFISGMAQASPTANPDWPSLWNSAQPTAMEFLRRVEARSMVVGFAYIASRHIDRQIAAVLPAGTAALLTQMQVVTFPLEGHGSQDFRADLIAGIVTRDGREVGRFECFAGDISEPAALESVLADFRHAEPYDFAHPDATAPEADPAAYWEAIFAQEDPWDYENPYEALKYDQTLAALPHRVGKALELACAEGFFTRRLATMADHVLATDISPTAVERARKRLAHATNVTLEVLDFVRDPLPPQQDLIVCSEVLYYLESQAELTGVAKQFQDALAPGGYLLSAHARLTVDEPDRIGFDWSHEIGGHTIAAAFGAQPGLQLVTSWQSRLYRIDLFQKSDVDLGPPQTVAIAHSADIPERVARYICWTPKDTGGNPDAPKAIPVLMYHRVTDDPVPALAQWAVSPASFRAQMEWLAANGFTALRLHEFEDHVWNGTPLPQRPVLITFDDGYVDTGEIAVPLLQEFGHPATIFLPTGHVGGTAIWDSAFGPPPPLMGWTQIEQLATQGFDFAPHTVVHKRLTAFDFKGLQPELTAPADEIAARFGRGMHALAYPYGAFDEPTQRAALAVGCRLAFTTQYGKWQPGCNVMAIPRLEVRWETTLDQFAKLLM